MKSPPCLLGIVTSLLLTLGAGQSLAAIVPYTSSTDFFIDLGGSSFVTEGYGGLPINSTIPAGTTLNGITYTNFPAGTDGRVDNLYNHFGDAGLALQRETENASCSVLPNKCFFFPNESFSVAFTAPVFAVGIFFNVAISREDYLFIQTPVGTATTGGASYDQPTFYFAGLISDTAFSTATFGAGAASPGSDNGFTVDNLIFAASVAPEPGVPEPATLALLGIALAGLGISRRRKPALSR